MAMLKDTVVAGSLRATDSLLATTVQMQILNIPTASNGTTFGPGTNGQILKSNGTSVYWASDNNSDVNVTQAAAITTAGAYPLILANSTATTAVTGTVNKTSTLTYNPNTKALVTGGTVNGYTLAAASAKGVDTSIAAASTSANLPTSAAVATFVEGKKYVTTDTKTTAGTSNKTGTKMFLVAATEQSANPTTYSNSNCYIGTDNCLYSGGTKVLTAHQSISGKLNISGGSMTGRLTTNKALNMVLTGTGVAGGDRGSSANPRYFPAVWTFNAGITPQDGDIVSIKIPCAGHDYGVFMSTNNGTNSYPVVMNSTGRLTTHFANGCIITLQFDSAGSAASMFALAGQNNTTRVTVTGGVWRVFNLYDSGNTNDSAGYIRNWGSEAVTKVTTALYRYTLVFSAGDGIQYIPANTTSNTTADTKTTITTAAINFMDPIYYYTHTDTVAAAASVRFDRIWTKHRLDLRYSFNIGTTLTSGKCVYLVVKPTSSCMGTLRNPGATGTNASAQATGTSAGPITQILPTSDDGYVYVLLGRAYNTYCIALYHNHPAFWYKNGAIQAYTAVTPRSLSLTATSSGWSSSKTQSITATGVTANNTIIVGLGTSLTEAQYDAAADAKIICTAQAANSITLTCLGDKPSVNIPISVVILGV